MLISDLLGNSHKRYLRCSGGCHKCKRARVGFVPAELKSSSVIIVGEAPGDEDVKQGQPFVGAGGRLLRANLEAAGISDYSLTNTVHCHIPGNKPKPIDIENCMAQFTLEEVRGYPIVVLAGNSPVTAFFPGETPSHYRGNVAWHPDYPGQRFYSIYHPSYVIRRKDLEGEFEQQIQRLGRIVRGENAPGWKIHQGGGPTFWQELEKAFAAPLISLDIETNKLESWHADAIIRSLSFTADGINALFVHRDEAHFPRVIQKLIEFLTNPGKHVVGANIGFDLDFLELCYGFQQRLGGIHDVATIYYEAKQYKQPSLKELVGRELDGYRYLIHDPSTCTDLNLLANYNVEDVIYPLALFRKGMAMLKPKTRDMVMRVSGPSGYILRKITSNGFYLRQDYWREKIEEYKQKEKEILLKWRAEDPAFIPTVHNSGNGLKEYLFQIKRVPLEQYTETGEPSTDETAIKAWIRQGYTILQHLLDLREVEKIRSTYLDAYEKYVDVDGRIHSSYTNTFTDSVRSSSRKPNLQNIPRNKEIRNLFGVPPGSVLIESDFSQIELRIMMCLAQDPNGIQAYLSGQDLHTRTAMSFAAEPTKEHRTWAKVINFALCVPMDTRILTRDGWKTYDQVVPGVDETIGFDGERMVWTPILRKVKYEDQPLVRSYNRHWSAVTTPDHRWYGDRRVDRGKSGKRLEPEFFRTNEITPEHRIWLSRPLHAPCQLPISPAEAEIIGWLYTDGSINWKKKTYRRSAGKDGRRRHVNGAIFQQEVKFAENIRQTLAETDLEYIEETPKHAPKLRVWRFRSASLRELLRRADLEDNDLSAFVRRLGTEQLARFVKAVREAEGTQLDGLRVLGQNEGPTQEAIELALFLHGNYVTSTPGGTYKGKTCRRIRVCNPNVTGQRMKQEDAGRGDVWCVTTGTGTWTMNQQGRVMVTGNCYGGDAYKVQQWARDQYGLDWTLSQAQGFVDTFFRTYPYLKLYHEKANQELRANRGWFESITGHTFYYADWDSPNQGKRDHAYRSALNARAQGPAAQICFLTMIGAHRNFHERKLDAKIVNTVHDSLLTEVGRPEQVPEVVRAIEDAKDVAYEWVKDWFVVPLEMEHEIGDDIQAWGSLKKWELDKATSYS